MISYQRNFVKSQPWAAEVNENIKPADSTGSIKGKLKELKVMLDEGLISQEQYNIKSEELIENFWLIWVC